MPETPHSVADRRADPYVAGGRRKRRRPLAGCLAVLVAVAVLLTGGYLAVTRGGELLATALESTGTEDYPGPGSGNVLFQVEEGDSVAQIGRNLKEEGVTASVDAFLAAAEVEDRSTGIQVGYYPLKEEMAAADALDVLVDPANLVAAQVTIPEGLRVSDTLDILAKETDFSRGAFQKVVDNPKGLGLPGYADGNPEGYLFPSTYDIGPEQKPRGILRAMVDRWRQSAEQADLEGKAQELGKTPGELMIIASLIEAEGRGDDMPKISRVIYNRLDGPGDKGGTNGYLQIDASVNYGLDQKLGVALTTDQLEKDTPYNTYTRTGLPPTPIEAPGDAAIEAAVNPADGDWYYYVTVNLRTGETKFAETYDEFLEYRAEYKEYCETSDAC
jgi:UPF0755 protein